jgi:hypothetical protein
LCAVFIGGFVDEEVEVEIAGVLVFLGVGFEDVLYFFVVGLGESGGVDVGISAVDHHYDEEGVVFMVVVEVVLAVVVGFNADLIWNALYD